MGDSLEILAIEPFFGGIRRSMLETLAKYSRHHWTVLKLPPRRLDRRLSSSAQWFAELIHRHGLGRVDVVFASEALNLAEINRLIPELAKKPSVVYFHSNQLPEDFRREGPNDLVNLSSALASSEVWFNSVQHLRTFLSRATQWMDHHPDLAGLNPVADIAAKAQLIAPPVDCASIEALAQREQIGRDPRSIFVDTREAELEFFNQTFSILIHRKEVFSLKIVGPRRGLNLESIPFEPVSEVDLTAQNRALLASGIFLSNKEGCPFDDLAVRALAAGCWPFCPQSGGYGELLPQALHENCLHDGRGELFTGQIQDVWYLESKRGSEAEILALIKRHEPRGLCRIIDDRLDDLIVAHALHATEVKEVAKQLAARKKADALPQR